MDKRDILTMAYRNLMRRKARTFLTVLGVLIGTTSIVVMVSLGLGLSASNQAMMEEWGSLNEIEVSKPWSGTDQTTPLVLNDETLATFQAMDGVVAVAPQIQISGEATQKKLQGYLSITGVTKESMELLGYKLGEGRFLEEADKNVVIFGSSVGDQFYDPKNNQDKWGPNYVYDAEAIYQSTLAMLGERVTVSFTNYETQKNKKLSLEVIGILSQEQTRQSWYAFAPIETVKSIKKFMETAAEKKEKNKSIYDSMIIVTNDVNATLAICKTLQEQGYQAYSIAQSLDGIEQQSRIIQAVLGGIGSITLLVAAIGIINTMVMSIFERTREIGIMKVIGATFSDIRMLFLTEAGLIGLMGGVLGLLLSYGLSFAINYLGQDYLAMLGGGAAGVNLSVIPPWLALFSLIFSMMIGVLAGLYPANRAVKLSPIEAIRSN